MNETVLSRFREQIIEAGKQNQVLSIQGGNTKSWYGNPSQSPILSTTSYQGILDYQPEELVITACAGTPIAEIESTLAKKNQILPFEPPHFGDDATFGGVIAAGLAGSARISAGNLRDFVLGTRLMDGRGEDLSFGGKVMKNVAGYDVSRPLPGGGNLTGESRDIQWGWNPVGGASSYDSGVTPNYLVTTASLGTVSVLLS